MIQKNTDIHEFAYAVGLVRALENNLLSENEMERMLLAKTPEEALRILNETDFGRNLDPSTKPEDFQKVLDKNYLEFKEKMIACVPDKRILNILWMEYDFHNIKTMLKAKLMGKSFEDIEAILSKLGKINILHLKDYIFDGVNNEWGIYPKTEEYIKKRIISAKNLFLKIGNPQVIDLFLDQKLMKVIFGKAQDSKSEFLVTYIRKLIDLNNIRLFFRMQITGKDIQMFEYGFLWNGTIPWEKMRDSYSQGLSSFVENMKNTSYGKIVSEGMKKYEEENTLIFLEKDIENHLIDYIKGASLITFGPEPIIAYLLAKKNNAFIVRMIMVNKLNKIPPEEIKERLRILYR
ncbi:MAG: V-type ATPase subunit [Candidatus Gracilibacteria bacterium]|jgi:V/A-type H+-transporting ATPase subunit C|nr:V-type ATPase subunit [Candidatus Gracilibacteria bacterium]